MQNGTWIAITAGALCAVAASAWGGQLSTTVITHGFSIDSKGPWVEGMAEAILDRAGEGSIYRYTGDTGAWTYVASPFADGSSDVIVLIFNWVLESDGPAAGPNLYYAQAAGDVLYAMLRAPVFAGAPDPPNLPADLVSERAVHFIGHSRGACVNSEAARRLAVDPIPVDQITTLDPHPVNGILDPPYNYNWGDPTPTIWDNVLWADNYWRADGGGIFNGLDFDGIPIANAFNVQLSENALNCCAYGFAHSDVHLWLHGTVDLALNPCDGEQCITAQMRNTWWPGGYTQQGYYYSVVGGGSASRPGLPPGASPGATPSIMGGSFDGGSYAGWLHHGGSVNGQILTSEGGYLRLGPGAASSAVHNRLYLAENASAISVDYRVQAAAADEMLHVTLLDPDNQPYSIGSIALSSASGWVPGVLLPISASVPRGQLYTLKLAITAPAGPIEAIVGLDNLAITAQPPPVADVNGDGCVNIDDLFLVIAAWGPCPAPCPPVGKCAEDIDDNCVIDIDDLFGVIAAWGPC